MPLRLLISSPAQPGVVVLGLDGSELLKAAAAAGLATASEGFADRAYDAAGLLVSRTLPGSVLDAAGAVAQAISIAHDATVTSIDGTEVKVVADSICIHGDTPGALALAKELRAALAASGVSVEAFV